MKKVAILVPSDELNHIFGTHWSFSNLNDYVAYHMKPHLLLHTFAYFDFEDVHPINGKTNRKQLKIQMETLLNQQKERIKLLKSSIPRGCTIEKLTQHKSGRELLELLAGKFTENSHFYNPLLCSSYINQSTVNLTYSIPEKYVLAEINLHK